jgi:hypothetical protein
MVRRPRQSFVKNQIFFRADYLTKYSVYDFPVTYEYGKENQASKFSNEFTVKWRPTQKNPLQSLKLILDPHDRFLERHLRLDKRPLNFPGREAHLQCLGPDSQCNREHTMRISKKCGIEDSMLNFKRND